MTDTEIKVLLATKVIKEIPDKSIEMIIRRILFNPDNKINWEKALLEIKIHMPELSKTLTERGYENE